MRTQYGKSGAQAGIRYQPPDWFASHCYLVVVQDIRGQGASGGTFSEFTHDQADGYDSVEWAAALPGSNGKVGMYGSSYVGATQWLAAVTAPPHLVTIVPANTASDYYDGWTYEGGEFRLAFVQPWAIESIATTAAENRGDPATVAELAAAARGSHPVAGLPPVQGPAADAAGQPGRGAVVLRLDPAFDARRLLDGSSSIRDRYPSVDVPVLRLRGLVRRVPRRRRGELRRDGGPRRQRRRPRQPAAGDRPVGPRRLGPSRTRSPRRCSRRSARSPTARSTT